MVFIINITPDSRIHFLTPLLFDQTGSIHAGKNQKLVSKKLDRKCDRMVKTAFKSDMQLAPDRLAKVNFAASIWRSSGCWFLLRRYLWNGYLLSDATQIKFFIFWDKYHTFTWSISCSISFEPSWHEKWIFYQKDLLKKSWEKNPMKCSYVWMNYFYKKSFASVKFI